MIEKKYLDFYLRYGYFPHYNSRYQPEKVECVDLKNKDYNELLHEFNGIIKKVISEVIKTIPDDKKIVIPLSGGLDSRAILAVALDFIPSDRILTYTFGTKGSYDFELGQEVAYVAGVENIAVELNSFRFSQNEMLEVSKRCDWQTNLFHHPTLKVLKDTIKDGVVISGYLGDLVFGSYAGKSKMKKEDAIIWYYNNCKYTTYFDKFEYDEENEFLFNIDEDSLVSPVEQLILYERGPKLTAPHILMMGWDYRTPLIDKRIMDFMFSLPSEYREKEKLFIDSMLRFYPKIFNIKAKTTFGLHLKSPYIFQYLVRCVNLLKLKLKKLGLDVTYPPYNYIDFNYEIIYREDLREIFHKNILDLKERNILGDICPLYVWEQHLKQGNNYQALITLVSLELTIKSKEHYEG